MRNIIKYKIEKLAEEARDCDERNAAIVLFGLAGAMCADEDHDFAGSVQDYIRNTLLPRLERGNELDTASKN